MKVTATAIPEVLVVESPVFHDERGYLTEIYHAQKFAELGLATGFVQDNHSRSTRHVLRGMHYQLEEPQGKLVRVVSGAVFDVAVDLRRSSPTFGRWVGQTLEAGDGRQVWIPEGFAHGFLILSDVADVTYKCIGQYRPSSARALVWDDSTVGVIWPLPSGALPKLAERDAAAPGLSSADCFA